jgi:arylsulfatase A-like enzyme
VEGSMTSPRPVRPSANHRVELTSGSIFRLVVWLAFAAGLSEGTYRLIQKLVLGRVILMPLHVIWMAPLTDLLWLTAPALVLLGAYRLAPARVTYPGVAGALIGLAAFPLLLLATSMHKAVLVILALGVGVQASRMVAARPEAFKRMVRRSVLPLVLLAALVSGLVIGSGIYRERRSLSRLPQPQHGRPNVLLIIWDTVRESNLSLYGYQRPTTPFLERFAQSGARFDMAIATAPWTLPSHASMFTGHRPTEMSARLNTPLDRAYPVIAEVFSNSGYATGGFAANMSYCARDHGLGRGFTHYEDYRLSVGGMINSSRLGQVFLKSPFVRRITGFYDLAGRKNAVQVNRGLLRWIDRRGDRPFFAFLNYFDAHQPYIAPREFHSRFTFDSLASFHPRSVDANFNDLTAEEIHWSMGEYDAAIAYQDSAVAELMAELDRRGLLDNTVIVIASDHGEHFGEHQRISHGNSLYRQLLQVPLIIRFPDKVPPGTVVKVPASLADIPQTLFHLAGFEDHAEFPGASLQRLWGSGELASDPVVVSEMPTQPTIRGAHSLIANGYHYIRLFERNPELYRLEDDPDEITNLAANPSAAPIIAQFEVTERELYPDTLTQQVRPPRQRP